MNKARKIVALFGMSFLLVSNSIALADGEKLVDRGGKPVLELEAAEAEKKAKTGAVKSSEATDVDSGEAAKPPLSVSMSIPGMAKYDTVVVPQVDPYVLGPGDQLQIVDYSFADADKPPLANHTTILPDGTSTIYPLGTVTLSGMTLQQINNLVNKGHEGSPEIFVSVSRPRPVAVRVLGDVVSPGIYTIEPGLFTSKVGLQALDNTGSDDTHSVQPNYTAQNQPTTITSSPPKVNQLTLLTALQLAGGVRETSNITRIRVNRATGRVFFVDLWRLITEGDVSQDVQIRDGDTIYVSRGGQKLDMTNLGTAVERTRRVRVIGSVKKPGIYDMRPDDDLYSALAKAGGFDVNAVTRSVILTRKNPDGTVRTESVPMPGKNLLGFMHNKGDAVARTPVHNGDVIVVTESAAKKIGPKTATSMVTTLSAVGLVLLNSRFNK